MHAVKGSNDYPHLSVKDELRCTCDISLQIGLEFANLCRLGIKKPCLKHSS